MISVEQDDTTHVMTINSSGRCAIPDGPSIWAFAGPLVAIHAALMITTNVILYKVRDVADRYQEQKYVALASAFVCEVLVIGLPVLISVGDNSVAIFIVFTGLIALNDTGMLCFVFIPKVMFQRKKTAEGVNVGETILKSTYHKASMRESIRRTPSIMPSQSHFVPTPSMQMSESRLSGSSFAEVSGDKRRGSSANFSIGSIMEVSEEEDPECNKEQAQRKSFATPQTDPGTEDGEEEDDGDALNLTEPGEALKRKLEEEKLKNYSLELEVDELREKEISLKKRVGELEHLLSSNGKGEP